MDCKTLVDRILDSNPHIRYAAIFSMDGNIIASKEKEGITRLLSEEDTTSWAKVAVENWKKRSTLFSKIGKGLYAIAAYEHLRRITMPVDDDHLLYATYDAEGGQEDVIEAVLKLRPGKGPDAYKLTD